MAATNEALMSAGIAGGLSLFQGRPMNRVIEDAVVGAGGVILYRQDPLGFKANFFPDLGDDDLNDFFGESVCGMAAQAISNMLMGRSGGTRLVEAIYAPGVNYALKVSGVKGATTST